MKRRFLSSRWKENGSLFSWLLCEMKKNGDCLSRESKSLNKRPTIVHSGGWLCCLDKALSHELFISSHFIPFVFYFLSSLSSSVMDSHPYWQGPKLVDLLISQQDIAFGSNEDSVEQSSTQVPFLATQGTADSNFVGDNPADRTTRSGVSNGLLKMKETLKKRKCEDGGDSSSSQPSETKRPQGVKASKAGGKKTVVEENESKFQSMWSIKQQDLAIKERLSKMKLLDSLLAKKEPLAECEEALKNKLINELLLS
ncbi:hypothetical protein Bca52824_019148 [Brassica carinata]|uniref:No apical meristem-associated C-terminal domain-containing protein n=1 Tax=Brassica carinata TaxID=52824 RepID=A0A8X7VRB7_BRACI|nr:hypothetical protein Bca52824_019148 [Brassica carinata]